MKTLIIAGGIYKEDFVKNMYVLTIIIILLQ